MNQYGRVKRHSSAVGLLAESVFGWSRTTLFCLLFAAAGLLSSVASAQEFRGTIGGRITDPTGAQVRSAKVTATEITSGTVSRTSSTEDGKYNIPFLTPGTYDIEVRSPSFQTYVRKGVTLDPGGQVAIDIPLSVGSASEVVTVTSDTPLLEVSNAAIGQTITTQQVNDLPINGNSPNALTLLAVGVAQNAAPGFNPPFNNGGLASFSLAGGPPTTSEILLDGAPDSSYSYSLAYSAPITAAGEVQVYAFQPDAAYGHTGGGFVNVVTKGGSNGVHGTAYEFNQVSYLKANSYFTKRNGQRRPVTRYNQYGLEASGPVYIPKLYDGRNRVFWLFAWEGIRDVLPSTGYTTVPTDEERKGNFSALLKVGPNYQIYDPATGVASKTGSITRQPFANNIITPSTRLSPVAQAYLQFYPHPNVTGGADGLNNYFTVVRAPDFYDNEFSRIDANIGSKDKLILDFRHSARFEIGNNFLGTVGTGDNVQRINFGALVDNVYTIDPKTFLDVRANWTRYTDADQAPSAGFDSTSLGFPSLLAANAQLPQVPLLTFGSCTSTNGNFINSGTNFQCLGSRNPFFIPSDSFQLFAEVSRTMGTHSLRIGTDLREYLRSTASYLSTNGNFTFGTNFVTSTNSSGSAPLGQEFASFLLGLPTAGTYAINAKASLHDKYMAVFVQDDWRVTKSLTLNLGLRYDHEFPLYERKNRATNGFDETDPNPINAAAMAAYATSPIPQIPAGQFKVLGGLTFASADRPQIFTVNSNVVSPRFGFAWTPKFAGSHTVFRGGFGFFTTPILVNQGYPPAQGFSQTTSYIPTNDNYLTAATTLDNPFPSGLLRPAGSSAGLATYNGQSIAVLNPVTKNGYAERFNLDVQHQFGGSTLLEISYLGNHVVHLEVTDTNLNYIPRQYLSKSPVRDSTVVNALSATVNNPLAGLLPGSSLNSAKIATYQLLLPYPQYPMNGVDLQNSPTGSSFYNGLSVRAERRLAKGLSLIGNYTWSKQMENISRLNDSDPAYEHRISTYDHTHHVVIAATYQLPFGRDRQFAIRNRIADEVFGGWTLNSIFSAQTGAPFVWGNLIYSGAPLNFNPRNTTSASFNVSAFDTKSAEQLTYNVRTFRSTYGNLRQDGIDNLDASVLKKFAVFRDLNFQLRLEAFNLLNHATFAAPNVTPTSSQFGFITQQYNSPRAVQIGGRLTW